MDDDDKIISLYVIPINIKLESDYVKLVIDARYLNLMTDLTNYYLPLEPVQMVMTGINGKFFSVSGLSCAYNQVLLSSETQKLINLIVGGKQHTLTQGFYGLWRLPKFSSRLMTIYFFLSLPRNEQSPTLTIQSWSRTTIAKCSQSSMNTRLCFRSRVSKPLLKKLFCSEESRISWSRFLAKTSPTYCKTIKNFDESQINRK